MPLTNTFKFPESVGGGSVTFREPSAQDEIDAMRVAMKMGGTPGDRGNELLKLTVTHVDGKPIDWSGREGEEFLTALGAKKRKLLAAAYNHAFLPTEAEIESFLQTMETNASSASGTKSPSSSTTG